MSTIAVFIIAATVVSTIVEFAKPAYKKFAGKFAVSINIALAFALGILAAFSLKSFIALELNAWALTILGLAIGTGSAIFYDVWALVKALKDKLIAE